MAATLKPIKELELEIAALRQQIADRPDWEISKDDLLELIDRAADAIRSNAPTKGVMSYEFDDPANYPELIIGPGWQRVDFCDRSVDTQGVRDGINDATDPGSWWEIPNNAAGDYTLLRTDIFQFSTPGHYEFRFTRTDTNGNSSSAGGYRAHVVTNAVDEIREVGLQGLFKNMGVRIDGVRWRRMEMQVKGPNGSGIKGVSGQFGTLK